MPIIIDGRAIPVILIAVLSIPIFLFTLLPLLSCVSENMKGIYIVQSVWNDGVHPTIDSRIGYYGLCWMNLPFGSSTFNECIGTAGKSASDIAKALNLDSGTGIQHLLNLQSEVFVAWLTAGGVIWLVSLILVSFVLVAKPRAEAILCIGAKWLAMAAAIIMIANAWSTTASARAIQLAYLGIAAWDRGILLIALQWVAAVLTCLYALAVSRICDRENSETLRYDNID